MNGIKYSDLDNKIGNLNKKMETLEGKYGLLVNEIGTKN